MKAIYAVAYVAAWKSQDFNVVWTRDLAISGNALTNWAMKPLTLGAGHLWGLRSPWGMIVKFYMKYFIYWSADVKSSKLWSSQLWTQFMQLRVQKPEKVTTSIGFEPVTSQYRCNTLTNWAMKPLTLGAGNKSYIDINQSVENEQYISPTAQDLYTTLPGSKVWSITCLWCQWCMLFNNLINFIVNGIK